jgi:hypothetical protein
MASWLSIRDKAYAFYHRWKAEIQIYGIGLLLTFSGLATGRDKAAGIVFGIMILYDLMRRFGEPYRALGEQEFARKQQARQQWWREQTEDLLGRFVVQTPPPPPAPTSAPTRLIPAPTNSDEEPPESPASMLPTTDGPPPPPPTPLVTHQT